MNKRILGLDISSTAIGYVLWDGTHAVARGTVLLKGDLLQRMDLADLAVRDLTRQHTPDAVAIEGPTTRFASHVIAQQRVCGVALLAIKRAQLLSLEVSPATAKKALTGKGNATKTMMQTTARDYLPLGFDEHAADALGVAMAAWPLVRKEEAVPA